jgi:DNA modification methylase
MNKYYIYNSLFLKDIIGERPIVDVTITSPPYWNLKDYGHAQQIGIGQTYDIFLNNLENVFSMVYDVTKNSGSLWIVADTLKKNGEMVIFPFDLANRLKRAGWILQDVIIWNKDKTRPWSHKGKLRNIFEYILFFTKTKNYKYYLHRIREIDQLKKWWIRYPERYSPFGKAPSRAWDIAIPRQGSWGKDTNWVTHACPFPPLLVQRIIKLTTNSGDLVFDPFAGSGVTLAQAEVMKRRFIGIDLNKKYQRMYQERVRPMVKSMMKTDEMRNGRKDKFRIKIWQLRKLKYPREIHRLIKKNKLSALIRCFFVLEKKDSAFDIYIIARASRSQVKALQRDIQKLSSRAPLSKYELSPNIHVISLGEKKEVSVFIKKFKGVHLWRYARGITHFAKDKKALNVILSDESSKNKTCPDIFSDIFVRIVYSQEVYGCL